MPTQLDQPDQLVIDGTRQHGRFGQRPTTANPLDEVRGLRRLARRTRLKEWIGFAVVHPELWASMIVQDAKYLGTSELYAFDAASSRIDHHEAITRGAARLPIELFGADSGLDRPGYRVEYRFGDPGGRHTISVDIAATATAAAVRAELELDGASATPPLSVSAPLRGGSMYTYKSVFPVSGWLRVGEREYTFDPGRDLAILDEHRSVLPYRTDWTWGTFATQHDDGIVGANFASRPKVAGSEEESCLWTPSAAEPLADLVFTQRGDDPLDPWSIRSRDGRLDVEFEPVHREAVRHQLGVFAIDYFMLYGRYSGTVRGEAGSYSIDGAHGVCERMHARL
jgi:hypothetical protein